MAWGIQSGRKPNAIAQIRVAARRRPARLYLGVAIFILSAIPFFTVILLNGGAEASVDTAAAALGAVALVHIALGLTARSCSTDKLRFWDGMRVITAYMTFGIGVSAVLVQLLAR